jgi:hypothetical protein
MLSVLRFYHRHGRSPALTTFFPGDHTGKATPVPIPNTAVKLARADDTRSGKVGRCLDFLRMPPS